jgi:PAS domain S-box-containing protein
MSVARVAEENRTRRMTDRTESADHTATTRILIVEDVAADAELMTQELRRAGLVVTSRRVQSEAALRDALHSFMPDIVLSDHTLPQFNARDTLRVVRAAATHTPVIIVTGSLDEETAAEYIKAGATDYIVKHHMQRLGPAVRRALALRRALEDAARAEAARARSEQRFRKLVEYSSDVITLLDGAGRIVYSTQAQQPTLGYDQGELVGHRVVDLVHPDDGERAQALLRSVLAPGAAVTRDALRVRHKNGTWRDLEIAAVNRLDDPIVEAIVVTYHDVTDRKRAEAALRALEEQHRQAQKMEAIGRLASGVAHDFNNLLTAILGSAELLLEDLPADHPGRVEAEETRKAALRAADLTRQLLAFSRQQVLVPQVLDLNAVVTNVDKMLRRVIGEDVELRTVQAPGIDAVRADPGQLEQVLLNLAVNARDAMPRGGELTIETANVDLDAAYVAEHPAATPGRYVTFAVRDTGTGMDAETQARLFEPFFTTKEKGKGTGLGLATVYGIVKQSGGHISVRSEPGQGTTVTVCLPRVEAPIEPITSPARPSGSLRGSETILVVEDQEEVRKLTRRILEARGYRVLVAASGADAVGVAGHAAAPIDLLLTDIIMPGMSGHEVALLLGPTQPNMRVLFVSGYTDESIVHPEMLDAGRAFLAKPFTAEALARKVREVLDAPRAK